MDLDYAHGATLHLSNNLRSSKRNVRAHGRCLWVLHFYFSYVIVAIFNSCHYHGLGSIMVLVEHKLSGQFSSTQYRIAGPYVQAKSLGKADCDNGYFAV